MYLNKDTYIKNIVAHCSAIKAFNFTYIFPGISESGKSTIAKKLNGLMTPINDEKNILEFSEKGVVVKSYFPKTDGHPKEYLINHDVTGILKAALFPIKEYERDSFIEPLTDKGLIWRKLLTCVAPPITGEDHLFPNYYEMIDRLMDSVPFFNIYHNLKDSPEFIAELLRSIK